MDRLRSLQYFIAAAEAGSFSGAARELDVSVAAVSKLVTALERALGVRLFERHAHGLGLTASGASYLQACQPALAMLAEADAYASATNNRARGTVVVGVQPVIAQECLTPALPRFNALYPDIQLDIRSLKGTSEEESRGVDVFLLMGWPQQTGHLVHRRIGAVSHSVVAAPSYWAAHGMPQHPSDLERHNCLTFRGNNGTLMDLWHFKRGEERVSVTARGWLLTDNVHRDMVRDVVRAGGGVARLVDWQKREGHEFASGDLVRALTDWELTEVPPVNLLYPPSVRRTPRVRLFIDFVTQMFRDIEQLRETHTPASGPPRWMKGHHMRASSTAGRDR
jgi:LysR family transcriptional regulator for bpeEF and oprC